MLSTTCGLSIVVMGIALLLSTSLEVALWNTQHTRPTLHLTSTSSDSKMIPAPSMDTATGGQLMLHTAANLSTGSGTAVVE